MFTFLNPNTKYRCENRDADLLHYLLVPWLGSWPPEQFNAFQLPRRGGETTIASIMFPVFRWHVAYLFTDYRHDEN